MSVRMRKKGDIGDFKHAIVVGRWLVWEFQTLLIYWDFPTRQSLGLSENGQKRRKCPVNGSSLGACLASKLSRQYVACAGGLNAVARVWLRSKACCLILTAQSNTDKKEPPRHASSWLEGCRRMYNRCATAAEDHTRWHKNRKLRLQCCLVWRFSISAAIFKWIFSYARIHPTLFV